MRFITGFFLILAAHFLTSCENEPVDGTIKISDFTPEAIDVTGTSNDCLY